MASRIEGKRETSPISSAQVSAVIGPTPGTVLRRLIRSASKGSRCRELTRAYSVFCSRTMLSRLTRSRGRILSFTSALLESSSRKYPTLCSRRLLWLTPVDRRSDSSSAPSGAPAGVGSAGFGVCLESRWVHVAFRQEVAAQAVGDLAGIDAIVLLLGRSDGAQHQRMRYLHLLSVREQLIVDPAGENRCFHGYGPGLRKRLHPAVQFPAFCSDLAFLVNLTARILDAVADRLLVNIQSDVIHMSLRSLRGCSLNQRSG